MIEVISLTGRSTRLPIGTSTMHSYPANSTALTEKMSSALQQRILGIMLHERQIFLVGHQYGSGEFGKSSICDSELNADRKCVICEFTNEPNSSTIDDSLRRRRTSVGGPDATVVDAGGVQSLSC